MEVIVEKNVKVCRMGKLDKKLLRKQVKSSHTLLKHEGISTRSEPTKVTRKIIVILVIIM